MDVPQKSDYLKKLEEENKNVAPVKNTGMSFAAAVLLLLLLVLLLSFAVYSFIYEKTDISDISPSKETGYGLLKEMSEIAEWKDYRNESYGFEIKYPPAGRIEETRNQICNSVDEPSSFIDLAMTGNGNIRVSPIGSRVLCGDFEGDERYSRTVETMIIGGREYAGAGYRRDMAGERSEYYRFDLGDKSIHFMIRQNDDWMGSKLNDKEYGELKNLLKAIMTTYREID